MKSVKRSTAIKIYAGGITRSYKNSATTINCVGVTESDIRLQALLQYEHVGVMKMQALLLQCRRMYYMYSRSNEDVIQVYTNTTGYRTKLLI